MAERPSWDEYFMQIALDVATRSTCLRRQVGAVIVRDRRILTTGYNGAPMGLPHCLTAGCHLVNGHCIRCLHAEQNAICQAAKNGVALDGATLYCRMTPCRVCAMLIINCGIKRVVCQRKYHAGTESENMFATAGVKLEFFHEEVQQYEAQKNA